MPRTEKQGGRICRRCLLYEMAESAEYQNVYAYIEGLDDEIRAPKALYEKRLSCCKSCGMLLSGMCRACGCFVELRAAIAANRCPYEKWQR
ncbi:MAG TPA: hypothetical protein H9831_10515 [Candidatus Eisenbergiella pullistercoris]|uniref:Uncharacterized protein n=1 Tax=Candidatus Eisenbergiella pullistercoris TaxID=2838555 RepID=A0A9D2C831_9FIRM|nr:hypothetical protein [Candidatus Eisenbergiella pullistercoris]